MIRVLTKIYELQENLMLSCFIKVNFLIILTICSGFNHIWSFLRLDGGYYFWTLSSSFTMYLLSTTVTIIYFLKQICKKDISLQDFDGTWSLSTKFRQREKFTYANSIWEKMSETEHSQILTAFCKGAAPKASEFVSRNNEFTLPGTIF